MSDTAVAEEPRIAVDIVPPPPKRSRKKRVDEADIPLDIYWEYMTPQLAAEHLSKPVRNRDIRDATVRKYKKMMEDGDWFNYHPQPLIFDADGRPYNGRHRMQAMMEAEKSYWVLIARYKPGYFIKDLAMTFDAGDARTTQAILKIGTEKDVTSDSAAVARYMKFGMAASTSAIPIVDYVNFYTTYAGIIFHVLKFFPKSRSRLARPAAIAACARAMAPITNMAAATVERFAYLLEKGMATQPHDHTVIALRNWLVKLPKGRGTSGGAIAKEMYARTAYALAAFANQKVLEKSYQADKELFPLHEPPIVTQPVLIDGQLDLDVVPTER
jgi:hypothetical protein